MCFPGRHCRRIFAGQDQAAEESAASRLSQADRAAVTAVKSYLVGAGPGDPESADLRALAPDERADVVLYDRLVPHSRSIDLCRRECERIYVWQGARRARS